MASLLPTGTFMRLPEDSPHGRFATQRVRHITYSLYKLNITNITNFLYKLYTMTNNSLYKRLSILKIKDLYKVELAKFFHSYQRNKLPQIFQDYFQPVKSLHKHFTRNLHTDKFYLPACTSNSFKSSIYFEGVQIWNNIDELH